MTRYCTYRACTRTARPGHTTCAKHYSAGRSMVQERMAKPRKRASKAQALVNYGLADNLVDARAQLRDMGE